MSKPKPIIILLLILFLFGTIAVFAFHWFSTSYGSYSVEGLEIVNSENVDMPREHFEWLISLANIDVGRCPRFIFLLSSPGESVTLTPQDLMIFCLYAQGDEVAEEVRTRYMEDGPFSIAYDWHTTIFSTGWSH